MEQAHAREHPDGALQRVAAAIGRVRAFLREELDAAAAGDVDRLEALGRQRRAVEADVAEVAAQLALLRAQERGSEGACSEWIDGVATDLEDLFAVARASQERVQNLKNRVVDGLQLLSAVRRAAHTYEALRPRCGALVDREG
jgi:hypothetical protein